MAKSWKTVAAEWASETLEYDHLRTDFNTPTKKLFQKTLKNQTKIQAKNHITD